ncbi:MAG: methylthioribulose 1-phosphate dehydratase [Alphaproteobacteria bacterium]|nr:methylthioribulose 1-phosphate dehydratase [Alphaproteobacteria bacterium]
MSATPTFPALTEPDAIQAVIGLARWCGQQGWVPATSGNFSARIDLARAAITATGGDKGETTEANVIVADIDDNLTGTPHPRLSAEGPLHLQLYKDDPSIGAVVHAHPVSAVVLSRRHLDRGKIVIEGWEMQKAIRGIATHQSTIELPIFANDQDTRRLGLRVSQAMASWTQPVFGYLIAGHGIYAWGKDAREARRHLEAYAHLLTLILEEERRT